MAERDPEALKRYEDRWDPPTTLVALVFLLCLTFSLSNEVDAEATTVLRSIAVLCWIFLVIDLLMRLRLSVDRKDFLRHHVIDVLATIVPVVRVFLLARVIKILARPAQKRMGDRALVSAVYLTVVVTVVCSVFVVEVERDAPGSNIKTLGEGLWWGIVTVITVGYGDYTPVTPQGRVIGSILIVTALALGAVITASISSRFVRDSREREQQQQITVQEMRERLMRIEAAVGAEPTPVPEDSGPDVEPEPPNAPA